MKYKENKYFILVSSLLFFVAFFSLQAIGTKIGLTQAALISICNAPTAAASVVIAYLAFQLNRRNTQEPWLLALRELHKDFWGDDDMAKVRSWLCCDDAYKDLQPVLVKRLSEQSRNLSSIEYASLETLDRFCSLMVRVIYIQRLGLSSEQDGMFKRLGYHWWIHQACNRPDVRTYIGRNWENLSDYINNEPFANSFQGA